MGISTTYQRRFVCRSVRHEGFECGRIDLEEGGQIVVVVGGGHRDASSV